MENILTIYGKSLKNARMAVKGVTQSHVADHIGIQRTTYTNWESKDTVEVDKATYKKLIQILKIDDNVLTNVPHETKKPDILEHPVIKSLVAQSDYILKRVAELEAENRRLRGQ